MSKLKVLLVDDEEDLVSALAERLGYRNIDAAYCLDGPCALEKLAATFGESTLRAEEGVETLRQTTEVLQDRFEKAQALKDDLAFLIERGDRTADKLENLVRATRDTAAADTGAGTRPEPVAPAAPAAPAEETSPLTASADEAVSGGDGEVRSEAERELLKAIRSAG